MDLKKRLENVTHRINNAALKCSRDPESIQLVAVTKMVPTNKVREAIEAGVTTLGENYVQEARNKFNVLGIYPVSWHFIGHLQSNKAKYAVRLFDLIHSVDTLKLARELNKQAKKVNKIQDVLIQINISKESSKSGSDIENAANLIKDMVLFENLSVKGLMAMPPFFNNPEKSRPYFIALRKLKDQIQNTFSGVLLNELSMGMTGDFEVAIEEGATLVRIGTAIFGERR
ncbi:MAG: YggS family pyridoxal phosphate-dependent enzyme [Deltaproteobacteria bacterium]|jgi:pyridoxal phosphate enzyme (YggS family)|nr:YggS family pyridoxal phosphate-dependent enzyme [Deltaproteobacteria bacterium]MBW2491703.1 YggS family pyridoxal phosphate-dependent enzyme [Deltaproteobacteria bacterium]